MHPFIEKYIGASLFPAAEWPAYLSEKNALEKTILELNSLLNKFNENHKLNEEDIEKALICGHADSNVFLFFISLSIACLGQRQHLEKGKSLVSIGENLISAEIQNEVHALFLQTTSRLKMYCGDLIEEKRLLKKSLELLKRDTPRYRANLINYAYMLARNGMLSELDSFDDNILRTSVEISIEKGALIYEILTANSIMQGDFVKGFEYLRAFLKASEFKKSSRYDNAFFSLNILSGNRDISIHPSDEFKEIAVIFEDFYENRWEVISEKINVIKALEASNPFINFISRYLPLHYEFSQKNIGKAKYILQENIKSGKSHFMDDLFYARIALLEKKKEDALFFIRRLFLNVAQYGYEGRINFELQFVREISASDLYFLIQKANELKAKNIPLEETKATSKIKEKRGLDLIIGKSTLIEKTKDLIRKYSVIQEPILVSGETGTGKELVAKALHDIGLHANEPFLAINCGALTDTLLQSELFGYEAGSFTGAQKEKKGIFEAAGKGTVFLDEFEDVSPKMQSSLLRVLETNEIRLIGGTKSRKIYCKIVIATNVELKILVSQKVFREDLYFRLSRFEIKLPALMERKEDISLLIEHFLMMDAPSDIIPIIDADLRFVLSNYRWPGNIRELRNAVERMKILHADKNVFGVEEFDFNQLENFSNPLKTIEKPLVAESQNKESNSLQFSEEEKRIQEILKGGFKIQARYETLKELFKKHKKLTRSQVSAILKVSPLTAANTLQALSEEGVIAKVMPSKSTKSHYYEWQN